MKGVILMLNEQDIKRLEEESKLEWESGNIEKAYEIIRVVKVIEPQ